MRPRRHLKFLLWGQEVTIQLLAAGSPLLHSVTLDDAERLFDALEVMAGIWFRIHLKNPEDTMRKAVVSEFTHLLTGHPTKYGKRH